MTEHRSWAYAPGIIRRWWRQRHRRYPPRLMLTHADFRMLVGAGEITLDGLTIARPDIGFHAMSTAINDAWELQMRSEI